MIRWFYIALILPFIFGQCRKGNRCFDQPGRTITKTQHLTQSYRQLVVKDDLNLILVKDQQDFIEIVGGENMVDNILLLETPNSLYLSNDNRCPFMSKNDSITIIFHYTQLRQLTLNGFGNISSPDTIRTSMILHAEDSYSSVHLTFDNDSLEVNGISGAPQIKLSGKTKHLTTYSTGYGNFYLQNLAADFAHGHNRGIGDMHLQPLQILIVELRSRGDFYIYETDSIIEYITNAGEGNIYYLP